MNLTKTTEQYIQQHPAIKDCMKNGLITYSALARDIIKDCSLRQKDFDAVLVACRRFYPKVKAERSNERDIIGILKKGKIEWRNKVLVAVLEKSIFLDDLLKLQKDIRAKGELIHVVEGANAIVLITSDEFFQIIKSKFLGKVQKISANLVEIIIKSPKDIETTPGVVSAITTLFYENHINIMEIASCWTDTIIIIEEKEISAVMRLLKFS